MKARFKFLVAACALALGASPLLQAQETTPPPPKKEAPAEGEVGQRRGGGRGQNIETRLKQLKEALALTDDQVAKIKAILEDEVKQIQAITGEDRREAMQKVRAETQTKIAAVLTDEQKAKFAEMRPGRGPGGGGGQGGAKKGPPPADKS